MNRGKKTQGFALVITLLITALVGTLVTGSLLLAMTNRRISSNDALSTQALNVAQAGSAYWKAELVSLYRYMLENFDDKYKDDLAAYLADSSNPPISCDNYFAIGIDFNRDGTIDTANAKTAAKQINIATGKGPKPLLPSVTIPVGDANGEAQVSFYIDGSVVGLRSRGSFAGSRATVVEEFGLTQASIWNNAVFTSTTAADATIQGRAEIRGSIHVLGEGVPSSSTVLDVSGNFDLGNNYEGLVSSIASDVIGTNNTMRLTNQRPLDLCATLRVKNGKVKMGGSSKIGSPTNSDAYVDNMRGIYTNYGFDGASDSNVFSVNGRNAKYDVGDLYDFPDLIDNTTDFDFSTGVYPYTSKATKKWQDKLKDNSLVLSTNPSTSASNPTPDDRKTLPVLVSDTSGSNSTIPVTPSGGWGPGKTYLSASCTLTPLFGVDPDGSVKGTSTTTAPSFELTYSTSASANPAFSCRKYRVNGSDGSYAPNTTTDEVVTEVVWTGGVGGATTTSGGTKTLGANELYVDGTGGGVMLSGKDLNISGGTIGYYGFGVLFAEDSNQEAANTTTTTGGNINLTSDFIPAANNSLSLSSDDSDTDTGRGRLKSATTSNTYPTTALVGLIARNNVSSDGSQRRLSTTIYAQEEVSVSQQTVVAGSIVAKRFDAGSQVPTVLYVPNLSLTLSKLMPGAVGSGFAVSNVAWNRR